MKGSDHNNKVWATHIEGCDGIHHKKTEQVNILISNATNIMP